MLSNGRMMQLRHGDIQKKSPLQVAQIASQMKYGDQTSPMSNLSHYRFNLEAVLSVVFNIAKDHMARSKEQAINCI